MTATTVTQQYRAGREPPARRAWFASAAGAAGAIALHLLAFSLISYGATTAAGPRHVRSGFGRGNAQLTGSGDTPGSMLVFIDPTTLSSDQGMMAPRTRLKPLPADRLMVPRLERLSAREINTPHSDEANRQRPDPTATVAIDGAERALLFGRYVSQISERIEWAWIRPRAAPGEPRTRPATPNETTGWGARPFRCRVEIRQAADGQVLEVTLLACDGSPAWQQSLVDAIDAASPLPAPPDQAVFARSLVIDFNSATSASSSASVAPSVPEGLSRQE